MSDSPKSAPQTRKYQPPDLLRMGKIRLRVQELQDAGKWDRAAYEELKQEWFDACGDEGDFMQSFESEAPEIYEATKFNPDDP